MAENSFPQKLQMPWREVTGYFAVQVAGATLDAGAIVGVLGRQAVFVDKNYTGEVMLFEMAGELVGEEGTVVATVLADDDVAVNGSTWTAGRRGTGATVFVEKIAGARAEQGADLAQVAEIGRRVNA